MIFRLFFCLHFLFVLCSTAHAETINVWIGSPLDGYGDIAANIRMAQKLKASRPEATIRILVPHVFLGKGISLEGVTTLLPTYDVDKDKQILDGVEYVNITGHDIPPADLYMEFSSSDQIGKTVPREVRQSAPVKLIVNELGDNFATHPIDHSGRIERQQILGASSGSGEFYVNTGAGERAAGFYISKSKPQPPLSRETVLEELGFEGFHGRIGFSYVHSPEANQKFLEGLSESLQRKGGTEPVLVFTYHAPTSSVKLPAHVRIVQVPLSLKQSEALIAHSDLPVAVTGDVSLSLALEYEKPFFYETLRHKRSMKNQLAGKLALVNPEVSKTLEILLDGQFASTGFLAEAFSNEEFLQGYSQAIGAIRSELSLPDTLDRLLDLYGAQLSSMTAVELNMAALSIRAGLDDETVRSRVANVKGVRAEGDAFAICMRAMGGMK